MDAPIEKYSLSECMAIPEQSIENFIEDYTKISGGDFDAGKGAYRMYKNDSGFYSRYFLDKNIFSQDDCESKAACFQIIDCIKSQMSADKPRIICYTEELMPKDIEAALKGNGFLPMLTQRGMIFDINNLSGTYSCPNIIRIESLRIDEWNDTMLKGFGPEKTPEPHVYRKLAGQPHFDFYAYLEDGRIVGTALLHNTGTNPGIHEVSVHPDFRHRGIARSLILNILSDLKKSGAGIASLQASPEGYFVYSSIGFREYTNVRTWIYG